MSKANIKFYYTPNTCSLASHAALEEAGEPYEAIRIDFGKTEQRSPEFLKVNAKGRVPVLDIDGFVLTENQAIMHAVARRHPDAKLLPDDPRDSARCDEWLAWCATTVQPAFAHIRRTERYATRDLAKLDVQDKGRSVCREIWTEIDRKLAAAPWAAGQSYSVADPYLLVFWFWGRGPVLNYDMPTDFPTWTDHARRVASRPSVRRVLDMEGVDPPAGARAA